MEHKKRRGRKPCGDRRSPFCVYLNQEERQKLKAAAYYGDKTKSAVIREGISKVYDEIMAAQDG